jgi:signal transduction histidine kinase
MMWTEWLSTGPMIIFLLLALTEKKDLSNTDLAIVISFFMCMVFGFLPIIPQPRYLAYLWIALSVVACLPVLYLPWYVSRQGQEQAPDILDLEEARSNQMNNTKRHLMQYSLATWMAIVCPLFPLNYLLAATKVIGPGESVGVFLLLTLLLKAFFAASLADAHTLSLIDRQKELEKNAIDKIFYDLEKERYANESRRTFFKFLFHEVRTPLNTLTIGIELLSTRDVLDSTDQELLVMMRGASEYMGETLNNVLSMQKIEEGKMELSFAPFSISGSITKIFSALSGSVITKNLVVERSIAADVPPVLVGDVFRVEHVISNLLSNAIKFSPEGGAIRVNVTATATAIVSETLPLTSSVTVSITDEGPGISGEDQGKLFNGFVQIRPDQLQQGKGSGLGLALCKQIVSLHGGTIGVDSAEGQGSTFHFCIPFGVPSTRCEELEEVVLLTLPALEATTTTLYSSIHINKSVVSCGTEVSTTVLVVDGKCKLMPHSFYCAK